MARINSSNAKEHSYPVYGRQFKSYKWYKPILVGAVFLVIYVVLAGALTFGVSFIASIAGSAGSFKEMMGSIFSAGYDGMELANPWQSAVSLGTIAIIIPALWLATIIVRDRPFTSYSSSRGGWSKKVFRRAFYVSFVCVTIPIVVDELFVKHNIDNYHMGFTLVSFAVVTILGPLQCIAEEYIFRGLLMQTLGSWFRIPVVAVILQSVAFALMHPYNTIGKIEILVSGLVFALAAWIGRGIEISSAYHICNNMTLFYMQGLNVYSITSETTVRDFIFNSALGVIFVLVIFIISRNTDWFNRIKKDDAAAWNKRIDEKMARKEGALGKHNKQ